MSSFCTYWNQNQCRSCQWIERDYLSQIEQKERILREAFSKLGLILPKLEVSTRSPVMGFRNRAKMTVTGTVTAPTIGLQGEEELDSGRDLLNCPIHHPRLNAMMALLPGFIKEFNLIPYQIEKKKGELKGLIVFYSPLTDQMYLRFILRSKECVSRIGKLVPKLQKAVPSLVCISVNIQPIPHAILEGPEEIILTPATDIDHQLGSVRFKLAPQAFVQTNAAVATLLYEKAAQWIGEARPTRVLELYCGQGAFSFFAEKQATQFLGIEINPEAVKTANETARDLGLDHLRFKASDAALIRTEIDEFQADLILVNPPRKGLKDTVKLIQGSLPRYLIYSSCEVETLASDFKILSNDYRINKMQLFDMFPHTKHFETLVLLERISEAKLSN